MDSLLLGHDSDWWNSAMLVSLGLAAFIALLVAAATTGVIVVQKREAITARRELDRYKLTVDAKVADARTAGIEAGKTAGDAYLRAANAELELAKLKSPRTALLTPEKIQALVTQLSAFKGQRVSVAAVPPTWESLSLADLLLRIFSASGLAANANQIFGETWVGVRRGMCAMFITGSDEGQRFAKAFAKEMNGIGIAATAEGGLMQTTKAEMLARNSSAKATDPYFSSVAVVVGEKPQPARAVPASPKKSNPAKVRSVTKTGR